MLVPVQIDDIIDLEAAIPPKDTMNAALEEAVEGGELKDDENNQMIYEIFFLRRENQHVGGLTGKMQ